MAPRNKWLTTELKQVTAKSDATQNLIQQLEGKVRTFHDETRSLLSYEQELFKLCVDLLTETAKRLKALSPSWRSTRLQARTLLCNVFSNMGPEVFLLCTVTISISKLAEGNHAARENRVSAIKEWWTTVTAPERLKILASQLCEAHSIRVAVTGYLRTLEGKGK